MIVAAASEHTRTADLPVAQLARAQWFRVLADPTRPDPPSQQHGLATRHRTLSIYTHA
jgi:hypothetical protein